MFHITYNDKIQTVNAWAHELGIDSKLIYRRMGQGIVDPVELFKVPYRKRRLHGSHKHIDLTKTNTRIIKTVAKYVDRQPRPYRRKYTCNGNAFTVKEWAKKLGYNLCNMYWRLHHYPLEIALIPNKNTNLEVDQPNLEVDQPIEHDTSESSVAPVNAPELLSPTIQASPHLNGNQRAPGWGESRRKKPNPIRVSPIAIAKMRECIGRKDAIYGDNRAIAERLRRYLLRSIEVEIPRCLMTADVSPTARYFRHNNWILTIDGGLHIRMVVYGGAKQWRVKATTRN